MTDARIILWFTWFVACNYVKHVAALAKERLLPCRVPAASVERG